MNKSEQSTQRKTAVFSSGCATFSILLVSFLAFFLLSVSQVYAAPSFPDVCVGGFNTTGTTYDMIHNLTATSNCIIIAADNVTLDCHGFTINYAQTAAGSAININGYNFTTVRNCIIVQGNASSDNSDAIYLNASIGDLVLNNTITTINNVMSYGITLENTNSSNFVSNRINSTAYGGIHVAGSSLNNFTSNTIVAGADQGIILDPPSMGNRFSFNNITETGSGGSAWGIGLSPGCNNNTLSSNRIVSSVDAALDIQSNGNTIFNNTINCGAGDTVSGISITGSSSNNVTSNIINISGDGWGIDVGTNGNPSQNNTFSSNSITTAGGVGGTKGIGLHIYCSPNNIFSSNIITSIGFAAINTDSSGWLFYNNKLNGTTPFVFTIDGCSAPNFWNTTLTNVSPATNIVGGPMMGGNYYATPNGTGFSETCADSNGDGICNGNNTMGDSNNVDWLPLRMMGGGGPGPAYNVTGYVKDNAGNPIFNASVIFMTGSFPSTFTIGNGSYSLTNVSGSGNLQAMKEGSFAPWTIFTSLSSNQQINFTLNAFGGGNEADNVSWGNFQVFNNPQPPYAMNGPGCFGPGYSQSYSNGSIGPGQGCPNSNDPSYDLGAVWVDMDDTYISWQIMGPAINMYGVPVNGSNPTFCNSSSTKSQYLQIEFDKDSNVSTGCPNNRPCRYGSEYQIVVNASGYYFKFYNSSLLASTCITNGTECFTVNSSVNISYTNPRCDPQNGLRILVPRSAITGLVGLAFEVNVISTSGQMGPVECLGGAGMAKNIMSGPMDMMFQGGQGCGQYQGNQTSCNASTSPKCKYNSQFGFCEPDMGQMDCSQFCGRCSTAPTCLSGAKGKCMIVTAPPQLSPDMAGMNFSNAGQNSICVENMAQMSMQMGGFGNCDSDCKFCPTELMCNSSSVSSSSGSGKGCQWVNDPFFSKSWCDLSTVNTTSKFTCSNTTMERCFNSSACTGVGGTWDTTNNYCMGSGEICFNGIDDDSDGNIDCMDSDCNKAPVCGGDISILSNTNLIAKGGVSLSPMQAMQFQMFEGADPSPPVILGGKSPNGAIRTDIRIEGFGIKDMGKSLGMGFKVNNLGRSPLCWSNSSNETLQDFNAAYFYLLDTDGNSSTGCTANVSGVNYAGFEYELVYEIHNSTNGSLIEITKALRCLPNGNFSLFPAKMSGSPTDPMSGSRIACQSASAMIAIEKTDIGSPMGNMRLMGATGYFTDPDPLGGARDNLTGPNNNGQGMYYSPGAFDFKPSDCFANPMSCGSAFSMIGGGKFMPFEDCMSPQDDDANGLINCDDPSCMMAPFCSFDYSNDKTAPTVYSTSADTFTDFVMLQWTTNEPSNGTIMLYGSNSNTMCNANLANTVVDNPPGMFAMDIYRPFHGMPINNNMLDLNSAPVTIAQNTTYFYRLQACDKAGNCAMSGCLNFTTKATGANMNFQFKFDFMPPATPMMQNATMKLVLSNGTEINVANNMENQTDYIKNASIKFNNPDANWTIELPGVDFAKAMTMNLSSALNATNDSQGKKFIGMDNNKWLEIAQNLGADKIKITIPDVGDRLIKCQTDNMSNCQDVTGNATFISSNASGTTWEIPSALGFSVYGVNSSASLVDSCENLSNESMTYILNASVSSTGTCFTIANNSITLDCNGYTINHTGNSTSGVLVSGYNFTTIKNCNIIGNASAGDNHGIFINYSSNNTITNNTVSSNYANGIYLWFSFNNTIANNTISSNSYGIFMTHGSNNNVTNNTADSNYEGIYLSFESNDMIANNTISNSPSGPGIYFINASNNTVINNIANSSAFGIYIRTDSSNNTIYNNFFNGTVSAAVDGSLNLNYWNTTATTATNIMGGNKTGGNFYATAAGNGYSQTCVGNASGFCPTAYSINGTNNTDYLPLTATIDSISPTVTLVSPANNSYTNQSNVSLSFNVTDNLASAVDCMLWWNSSASGVGNQTLSSITTNSSSESAGALNDSDGVTVWYINCTDAAGNVGTSSTKTFTRDTTKPLLNAVTPANNGFVNNLTFAVTYNLTEANVNYTNVSVYNITGGLVNLSIGIGNGSAAAVNVTVPSDGMYNITISTVDKVGFTNSTTIQNITVDTVVPVVNATSPSSNIYASSSLVTINYTVTEANINTTTITLVNSTGGTANSTTNSSTGAVSVNLTAPVDGVYNITISTSDTSGSITTATISNVTVDTTNPLLSAISPSANGFVNSTTLNITYNMTETNVNFTNINVSYSNGTLVNSTNSSSSGVVSISIVVPADGNYNISLTTYDKVSRSNSTTINNVTVDTISPVVNATYPVSNSYLNSTVLTINFTVTETNLNNTNISVLNSTGGLVNTTLNTSAGNISVSLTVPVDGVYNITLLTLDLGGRSVSATISNLTVDTTAPVITGVALNRSIVQNNTAVLVSVNYTELNLKNATAQGTLMSCSNGTCSLVVNLTSGTSPMNISVCDQANHCTINDTVTFIIDNTVPAVNTATLSDTYVSTGQSVMVTVNATDANGVASVTANGINLTQQGGGAIWNGTINLTGSTGPANATVVATDNAGNTNTTYLAYTRDNVAPVITVNSPANGSTVSDASGNLTLNYTVTEAQIISSNVSIDGGVFANSTTSNGTTLFNFTGIAAGTHTIVITAYDNASLSSTSTTTFVMSAPINATAKLENMQTSVGTATLLNVSLLDATNNSIDYSNNGSIVVTNLSLSLQMNVNVSATENVTVTIPSFNGSSANWNATNFDIETNASSAIGANTTLNTGANVTALVVFTNMSNFLANTAYINGTIIVFQQPLNNLTVLYIADDTGSAVYKLSNCSTVPTTVTLSNMCYVNTSSNVTVYVPHLSGAALANDTSAPTVNISSPANNTAVTNSYLTFSFDAWEANPNATAFCWYNLTNSSGQVSYASLATTAFTQAGTKYSYSVVLSGLVNNTYNMTVNCTDLNNQSKQVRHNFTIADTTAPSVTAISATTSGSTVTLSVTTSEAAQCRYATTDVAWGVMLNMTTTNSTTHSNAITYSASASGTYYVRCNDTAGNAMNTSNSTAFSVTVGSGTSCTESWTCTAQWSTCSPSGTKTRTCTDANSCGTTVNKPLEVNYCIYEAPATCLGTCGLGFYQQSYPGCACVALTCTNNCSAGQTRSAYPDCGCVSPVTNVTGPGAITATPKRDGVVIDIPGMAEGRSTSLGSYLTTAIMDATGIVDMVLTPNKDLTGVKVDIVKLTAKPATIAAPQGIFVYNYLEIKATNMTSDDLVNATVVFKIPKSFIGTKYNASSTVLMRLVGSEWTILETKIASQTTSDYIFESKTPGFSYFAIAIAEMGAPPIVITPQGNMTNETGTTVPPIEASTIAIWIVSIVVAAGIIAFAYQKVQSQKKWKPRSK